MTSDEKRCETCVHYNAHRDANTGSKFLDGVCSHPWVMKVVRHDHTCPEHAQKDRDDERRE